MDCWSGRGAGQVTTFVDHVGDIEHEERVVTRVGDRIVKANNDLFNAVTGLPGQFRDNWRIMRDPVQLGLLMRALVDDALLTKRRRKAIFSILLWGTLIVWAAVGITLMVVRRDALVSYQSGWSLFFYSVATSLALPLPFEFILKDSAADLGIFFTVLIAALGKTVGSWLVLLAGDKVNESLEAMIKGDGLMSKLFHGLMRFAQKYGYVAVFVIFAIPFMTDTAPLLVLAALRMRKGPFLAVTFVAIVVRSMIVLLFVA